MVPNALHSSILVGTPRLSKSISTFLAALLLIVHLAELHQKGSECCTFKEGRDGSCVRYYCCFFLFLLLRTLV